MVILVTGAGGYIGTTLVRRLLDAGHRVIGLDRYFFGQERLGEDVLANPRFELRVADIRNVTPEQLRGVDAVCDLAALSNDPSGDLDPELTEAINHFGRVNVANAARKAGVKRYVLASSCSVYGQGDTARLDESSPVHPITTYARANLGAERDVLPMNGPDFTVTVLRQATVFGMSRRMRFDLVINIMTLNAVEKGKLFITGGGRQWRPLVHVSDTARAFERILEASPSDVGGEVFNVGHTNLQVISAAYTVREVIPFPIDVQVVPDDPDKRNYNVSFEKMSKVLDFRAEITPDQGVREIYEGLKNGTLSPEPWTSTVNWYRRLLEAKALVDRVILNGKIL